MDEFSTLVNRVNLMEHDILGMRKEAEREEVRLSSLSVEMYTRTNALILSNQKMNSYMRGFAAALLLIPTLGTMYNVKLLDEIRETTQPIVEMSSMSVSSTDVWEDTAKKSNSTASAPQPRQSPSPCPVPTKRLLFVIDMRRFLEGYPDSEATVV